MNSESGNHRAFPAYALAVIGAFLIVGGLVWIMNNYTKPAPLGEDRADVRRKALAVVRQADGEVLNASNYVWEDQTKEIVRLPINRATELYIQMWQNPDARSQSRSNLFARAAKKFFIPPPAPSKFE